MMDVGRRFVHNARWLLLAQVLTRTGQLALYVVLARVLPLDLYASTTFVMLLATMFFPLYDAGLALIAVREIAQRRVVQHGFALTLLPLKIVISLLAYVAVLTTLASLGYTASFATVLVTGPILISIGEFFHVPSSAAEQMRVSARLVTTVRGASILGGILAAMIGRTPLSFALGYLGGASCGMAIASRAVAWPATTSSWSVASEPWWHLIRQTTPIAVQLILTTLVVRGAVVIVERGGEASQTAMFNTAVLFLLTAQQGVSTALQGLFPVMAKLQVSTPDYLASILVSGLRRVFVPVAAVMGLSIYLLPILIETTFGVGLTPAAPLAAVLMAGIPMFVINTTAVYYLRASHLQGLLPPLASASLAIVAFLGPIAYVQLGTQGVALTLVLAEAASLTTAWALLRSRRDPLTATIGKWYPITAILVSSSLVWLATIT